MKIPADFPVQPLKPGENVIGRATCGVCGLSWDDAKATEWTPAPSGRCPFEYFHEPQEGAQEEREPTPSQKLREAGLTRRPTWKSLPKDGDEEEEPRGYTADWQEEVRRLQTIINGQKQTIDNLMERNLRLQKLVLSYQQDNQKDYDASLDSWNKHD